MFILPQRKNKFYRFKPGEMEEARRKAKECLKNPYLYGEYDRGFLEVTNNHLDASSPLTSNQVMRLYALYMRLERLT